jgi:chromosome segregation ATPase
LLQQTIDDKRSELLKAESKLRETEEKYYSSAAMISDKVKDDLREEIRLLKQKLKETESNAGQDRYLRSKLNDDSANLVKENAQLTQQVLELQKQLERERSLRESTDTRHSQNVSELATLKDHENNLRLGLDQAKDQLRQEQEKVKHLLEQIAHLEQMNTGHQLSISTAHSHIAELTAIQQTLQTETEQLRRDNSTLAHRLSEAQHQVDEKQAIVEELELRLHNLEPLHELQISIDSQKWEEFGRLATSMKTLALRAQQARSPPATHSASSPSRSASSTLEYS